MHGCNSLHGMHTHFRYTAGALQFNLGKLSTGNVCLQTYTVDGIYFLFTLDFVLQAGYT